VSTAYALSPDGLLLALFVAQGGGVAFYDVDRGIIVGRALLPRPPGELQFFEWAGDDALVIATDDTVLIYDGRTGSLRGSVTGRVRGFIATDRGPAFATSETAAPSKPTQLTLHPLAAPTETLTSLTIPSPVRAVSDLGKGTFLVTTETAAAAFDVSGKSLWTVSGNFSQSAFNPETGLLLWPVDGELHALDTATRNPRPALKGARVLGRGIRAPWFYQPVAPIVTRDTSGVVEAVDMRKPGSPIRLGQNLKAFAISAGSTHAAIGTKEGVISIVDLATGASRSIGRVTDDFYRMELTRDARFVTTISLSRTQVLRGDSPDGKPNEALFTLPRVCSLHTSESGELRLADCDRNWFDLRGAGKEGFQPRALDLRDEQWAGDPAPVEGPDGTAFTARCSKLPPVTLGLVSGEKAAPGRESSPTYGRRVGDLRSVGKSPNGAFEVLHEVAELEGAPGFELVMGVQVKELKSGRTRLRVRSSDVGFAFDPDGPLFAAGGCNQTDSCRPRGNGPKGPVPFEPGASHSTEGGCSNKNDSRLQEKPPKAPCPSHFGASHFALAPVPAVSMPTRARAHQIDLYDLTTGNLAESVPAHGGGERPFFANRGNVIGFHTAAGVRLVRRADQRTLDVHAFTHDEHCDIFALTPDGGFEGEPHGALGFRLGNDLRTSEIVFEGPTFEAQRRTSLVAALFEGR
jgi:hypothetical protein